MIITLGRRRQDFDNQQRLGVDPAIIARKTAGDDNVGLEIIAAAYPLRRDPALTADRAVRAVRSHCGAKLVIINRAVRPVCA